jgi:tetratricopeptide (TPR) repeat protein
MPHACVHIISLFCSLLIFDGVNAQTQILNQKRDAATNFADGEHFMENNEWEAAHASLNTCLQIDPAFADAYYARGLVREHLELFAEALTDFSIHLALKPDHIEALFKRAQLHYQLKHYSLAKEDFLKLLEFPAGETSTIFFERSNFNGGVNQIFTAQGSGKKRIYNWLGLTETALQEYTQALIHFDSAIRLSPRDPDLYVNRGIAFEKNGDFNMAKTAYVKALEINSNHALAYFNLHALSPKLNQTHSIELLDSAIANNTTLPYAYAERGYIYLNKGKYLEALIDYKQAIDINPKEADYYLNRGVIYEKLKRFEHAYTDYSIAVQLDEGLVSAWLNRGNVLLKLKKEKLAIGDYSAAIAFEPDYAAAYYNRGLAYYQLKQYAEACSDLRTAKRLGQALPASLESKVCINTP